MPPHGGEDSGALGNDIVEKDLTLNISKYMYDRFKELGIPVALTRDSDSTLTSDNRPGVALSKFGNGENVIIISNHINAGGGEGAEVIYALRDKDTLSSKILNAISEKGQTVRKYYQRRLPSDTSKDYYYMLRNTPNAETVIVEYGFLDNANDASRLKVNYKDYADAVVEAVLDYKNIPYEKSGYYTVKKGDSLWSIAKNYNTSVNELKELNNLTSNSLSIGQQLKLPTQTPQEPSSPIYSNTYTVKKGDSLYSIATKYGITVNDLKTTNNLTSNTLSIGQVLKIPGLSIEQPNTHTVSKGESLYSIANKYGTTVTELKNLNNLTSNNLSIGQVLKLPGTLEETTINTYTVKSGDTLYSIANKYNLTVTELKQLNNLTNNTLSIGQLIKIPTSNDNIYTVKKGDTLWSIASNNNTTVDNIKNINNLISNSLTIGQQLLIS